MEGNHIIINLGVLQIGKHTNNLGLKGFASEEYLMSSILSMEISISGDHNTGHVVELPILTDMVNEPFLLPLAEDSLHLVGHRGICSIQPLQEYLLTLSQA